MTPRLQDSFLTPWRHGGLLFAVNNQVCDFSIGG